MKYIGNKQQTLLIELLIVRDKRLQYVNKAAPNIGVTLYYPSNIKNKKNKTNSLKSLSQGNHLRKDA